MRKMREKTCRRCIACKRIIRYGEYCVSCSNIAFQSKKSYIKDRQKATEYWEGIGKGKTPICFERRRNE